VGAHFVELMITHRNSLAEAACDTHPPGIDLSFSPPISPHEPDPVSDTKTRGGERGTRLI
jgi:hypothetical protein